MYNRRGFAVSPRTIGGFFEDVLQNGWNHINEEVTAVHVPVNIQETDNSYEMYVVAPGLKKEDFKLQTDRNILNISYDHKEEIRDAAAANKWLRNEYKHRSFKRSFTMNDKIDSGKISAKYVDGILNVSLPKKEVSEPATHDISVN